jgi:hypothetical protein
MIKGITIHEVYHNTLKLITCTITKAYFLDKISVVFLDMY